MADNLELEFDNEVDLDSEFDQEVDLDSEFDQEIETPEQLMEKAIKAQSVYDAPKSKEFQPEVIETEAGKMSKLEAAAAHAAPSLSLGLSDVLAGASGAAGHAVGALQEGQGIPKYEDLLETYYEAKKGEGKRRETAMEDQPAASVTGMIGGGFLMPGAGAAKALSNAGKVGKLASKLIPSTKGFSEAARAKKMASSVKDMKDMYGRYNQLRKIAVTKAAVSGLKEGAKAGAIMGSTMGDSELLKGDVAGTIEDTATGAASGAVFGGVLSGGTALSGAALEAFPGVKNIIKAYKTGAEGKELSKDFIQSNTRKLVKGFIKDMNKRFKDIGLKRNELLDNAKKLNRMVKTEDDVLDAIQHIEQFESGTLDRKAADYIDTLKEHLGRSKEMRKIEEGMLKTQTRMNQMDLGIDEVASRKLAKQQLKETLRTQQKPTSMVEGNIRAKDIIDTPHDIGMKVRKTELPSGVSKLRSEEITPTVGAIRKGVDPETGLEFGAIKNLATGKEVVKVGTTPKPQLIEGEASIDQAMNLKKQLQDYTFLKAGQDVPTEVKKSATKLVKQLDKQIDEAVSLGSDVNMSDFNKKFNKLYNSFESAGVTSKPIGSVEKYKQLQDMSKFITDAGDDVSFSNIEGFVKELEAGAPDIAAKYGKEIKQMRELVELSAGTDYIPLGANKMLTTLMGTIGGAINRGANIAGRAGKNLKNISTQPTKFSKKIIESGPEELQLIVNSIQKAGNKSYNEYIKPLQKAISEQGRTRAAIMFGLMQRPDFREMMKGVSGNKDEE